MSALYIQALLTLRRKAAGKLHSPSRIRAESKLLFNQALNDLSVTIDQTAEDDFPLRYHGIINLPRNRAPFCNHIDLLETVGVGSTSLILTQPRKNRDVVWKWGDKINDWRDYVRPYPVDAGSLVVPPRQRHIRLTHQDIRVWDRVAVMVPDACVRNLVRFMRNTKDAVFAVVAAEAGVCVILRTNATDYDGWQHWRRVVEKELSTAEVAFSPISLTTLVPISRESRGQGALLFLA